MRPFSKIDHKTPKLHTQNGKLIVSIYKMERKTNKIEEKKWFPLAAYFPALISATECVYYPNI